LHRDRTPLVVVLHDAQPLVHRQRFAFREDRRAAVPLLRRRTEVHRVALGPHHVRHVTRVTLRLLQAQHIRLLRLEDVHKTLVQHGPQPVHVPGKQLHRRACSRPPANFQSPFAPYPDLPASPSVPGRAQWMGSPPLRPFTRSSSSTTKYSSVSCTRSSSSAWASGYTLPAVGNRG